MTILKRTMLVAMVGLMGLTLVVNASVPFRGSGNAQITGINGNVITATATGQATHLGAYSRIEHITLGENGALSGDVTFTAANGDQLTADFAGGFTSESTASGTYTFTGGTGRFVNTTGTAYFSVTMTGPATFTVEFNGSLNN